MLIEYDAFVLTPNDMSVASHATIIPKCITTHKLITLLLFSGGHITILRKTMGCPCLSSFLVRDSFYFGVCWLISRVLNLGKNI